MAPNRGFKRGVGMSEVMPSVALTQGASVVRTLAAEGGLLATVEHYNALAFGIKGDGVTDDTLAWNNLFVKMQTSPNKGGEIFLPPNAKSLCLGALTPMPFGTACPSIRIYGAGASVEGKDAQIGSSILDLRYTGGDGLHPAKIDCRGVGLIEIDHLSLVSGGTDNFPFFQATNTTPHIHDNFWSGNTANSGFTCTQDAIVMGGTSLVNIGTGTADAAFQGYGAVLERNAFNRIRSGVVCQAAANAIIVGPNFWSTTCGGDATHGAITIGATSITATANVLLGNLIEVTHYAYPIVFLNQSDHNIGIGNGIWDKPGNGNITAVSGNGTTITFTAGNSLTSGQQVLLSGLGGNFTTLNNTIVTVIASGLSGSQFSITNALNPGGTTTGSYNTFLATCFDGGNNNVMIGNYTPDLGTGIPGLQILTAASGTFTPTATGNYLIVCVGGGGSGAGGGTPSSAINQVGGGGGAQGASVQQVMALISGTGYAYTIGPGGIATSTTAAGGTQGAASNAGTGTSFVGPSNTLSASGGISGTRPGASTATNIVGAASSILANLIAGVGGGIIVPSNLGVTVADGCGAGTGNYLTATCNGGNPLGYGAGGGGGGGAANSTKGGTGGAAAAFGSAVGGTGNGSGTINGTDGGSCASTSYGGGGGGGGAGATNAGTGGKGGAGGPGVIFVLGPYPGTTV